MDVLQSITNITCDTVKMNKGIKPDEVVAFVKNISDALQRLDTIAKGDITVDFPEPPNTKKLRIMMVEE